MPRDARKFLDPPVTMSDVARAAGVSKMTVSNVINDKTYVRPSTRARVEAAILDTGFRTNPLARTLAGGARRLIGVVVPNLIWPYVGEVIHGAGECASALGLELAIFTAAPGTALPAERSDLLRHLTGGVLLVLPSGAQGWNTAELPVNTVSIDGPGTHRLLVDQQGGANQAMQHLLELGHTAIAHIAGPEDEDRDHAARRLAGYQAAMRAAGLTVPPDYIQRGAYTEASGYRCAQTLLALDRPPTAIFAASDGMAIGAMHAAQDLGLRVPQDLSVVGYDDLPVATSIRPNLTTVSQPLQAMGADALRTVVRLGEDQSAPAEVLYTTRLVVRESSARPAAER